MTCEWVRNSKLSNRQIGKLIDCFVLEAPSSKAAKMLKINRHSADRVGNIIRTKLAQEVEVDESYFGGKKKGKRRQGAANKVPVFGILKLGGKVYTGIVDDVSRKTLQGIIRSKVIPQSVIYSDSFRSYDGLVLDGFKHFRISHDDEFSDGKNNHINGIENFWGFAKTKLKRYYGVSRTH